MKMQWLIFVAVSVLSWGAYVPTLHNGQKAIGANSALRAFLFVGLAYFAVSGVVLAYALLTRSEPMEVTRKGATLSFVAGILGAIGALGIVFAMKAGGKPLIVAPLVFAGAPIMNTFVSMALDKPGKSPSPMFFVGILLAAIGAGMALRYRPVADHGKPPAPPDRKSVV